MTQPMWLQRRGDELHLLGDAPATIAIAQALVDSHDPRWMNVDGDNITFTLTNGTWHYRITDRDRWLLTVTAELAEEPA